LRGPCVRTGSYQLDGHLFDEGRGLFAVAQGFLPVIVGFLRPLHSIVVQLGKVLIQRGTIKKEDRILVFNTSTAQKYPEAIREKLPRLDITKPIDWMAMQ